MTDAVSNAIPDWLTATLGSDLRDVARLPWGFTNETWGATTAGARYAATRMASPATASFVLRNGPEIARRVAAVGLAMPVPIPARSRAADGIVVSRWLEGRPAMLRLDGPEGAAAVGRALGDGRRRLDAVDIAGLELDATWGDAARLASVARGWLASLGNSVAAPTSVAAAERIQVVEGVQGGAEPSFVHGDLVPANMLLDDAGNVLLDLEAARVGDPLADAAWFRWIIRYHHPSLEPAAWAGFAAAAGLSEDDPRNAALLDAYPALRILEILATGELAPAARDRWLRQLEAAVGGPSRWRRP